MKNQNIRFKRGELISLDEYSTYAAIKQLDNKRVICIYDGKIRNGGLADRLRGIVSVYKVCKEVNIDLKINFVHPFKLTDFLIPNKVNWDIKSDDMNYNTSVTELCYIYTRTNCDYEARKQEEWFKKGFQKNTKSFT